MSVSSLGVGSGLDLQALLDNMVSVQRDTKVSAYNEKISDYKSEVSAYGAIKSALETFQETADKLNDTDLFTGRTASLTQPDSGDLVSVTASEDASNGSYEISVSQLAQGSRSVSGSGLFSSTDDVVSAIGGDLTFTAGSETFTVSVGAGATLSELREQINDDEDNFGVSANLVDDGSGNVYLTLNSSVTGSGNDLVVTNTDETLDSVSSVATGTGSAGLSIGSEDGAQDAIITVDGIDINSDSNTFENAISGLTIKALAESETGSDSSLETASASIDFDTDSVQETLESFVESYNSLLSTFEKYTGTGDILNGSSLVRGMESALNSDLMTTFDDAGSLSSIFDIGIEMDDDGSLSLNSTDFEEVMESSFDDVVTLFAGDTGIANIMSEYLEDFTGSGGLVESLSSSAQESADDTQETLESFEYRMDLYEEQLKTKFSNLDTLLAGLNNSGTALLTSLSNLSNQS
ncbi:flagellar filament capping protein FliD [Marinomonas balearica]|uniref:Flagellar hook-associated protein 2 n=1 Tax=Marinomonas balearica TaxID=491947 RepID=A0A4R6M4R6_9GAMM|nr:flagellar filament capping protein FliD [Marinomonas balearica]TDO96224.1 flagellar hook-associated protein 2 [Marinomonas balearica]